MARAADGWSTHVTELLSLVSFENLAVILNENDEKPVFLHLKVYFLTV
jgi:hypothetical protein